MSSQNSAFSTLQICKGLKFFFFLHTLPANYSVQKAPEFTRFIISDSVNMEATVNGWEAKWQLASFITIIILWLLGG